MRMPLLAAWLIGSVMAASVTGFAAEPPSFARHVSPLFSRLGCNGGSCHGAVQGKNGFRLSLFGVDPALDFEQLTKGERGRRLNRFQPAESLLLLKPTNRVAHGGGRVLDPASREFGVLRDWIAAGSPLDDLGQLKTVKLTVEPAANTVATGTEYQLRVQAEFADGSREDVTPWCTFSSRSTEIAVVDSGSSPGKVRAVGVGDTAFVIRYGAEPVIASVVVPQANPEPFPDVAATTFVDEHVLAKLKRLGLRPAVAADDATFLRRVRLDVTGQLPSADEVRAFLANSDSQKRSKKIDELLGEPGYAALWTLKFCDLLRASDYGIYADGLREDLEAPRFQAWVRARLEENLPYDEFAARVLGATSRDGRSLEDWAGELIAMQEGYQSPRRDLDLYRQRKTLDIYWQRKGAIGVSGAMQVAHSFLGLRLECAQCHRHPHDVWSQDDLLSFANFFMRVREVGFQGDNEKKYPEEAVLFKKFTEEGKQLAETVKKRKEGEGKTLADEAKKLAADVTRLKGELAKADDEAKRGQLAEAEKRIAEIDKVQAEIRDQERRGKFLGEEVAKRVLHAQVMHRSDDVTAKKFASVTSPLGTQSSQKFRLLGETETMDLAVTEDPREKLIAWLRRPENPFFARAIVNRVWAHYFGRGIIDPPDDLSPLNPPSHPELLADLTRQFISHGYDLKWLHRTIVNSRTYQQATNSSPEATGDRANYAAFPLRRLPAEVLLDALNQATGTTDEYDMKYYHWPDGLRTVELPYLPRNSFVTFVLEHFGKPARNSSVQCDCERQTDASLLQILSLANHPRVWQKLAEPKGQVAMVMSKTTETRERISLLYLASISRTPTEDELAVCERYVSEAASPEQGLRGVLWGLLNSKEFVLQH